MAKKKRSKAEDIILEILTVNDLFIWSSWSLLQPFIALWATSTIPNVTAEQVGIATMIYTLMTAVVTKPLGKVLDRIHGYRDEVTFLALGGIISGIAILSLRYVDTVLGYYIAEAIIGAGLAIDVISWRVLFTKNIDQKRSGQQWSTYSFLMSIGLGLSAGLGGYITASFSYNAVFAIAGTLTIIGGLIPTFLYKYVRKEE